MRPQPGINRNCDCANLDHTKKAVQELRRIHQGQQDALLAPDSQLAENITYSVRPFQQLLIGHHLFAALDGYLAASAVSNMTVHHRGSDVEDFGQSDQVDAILQSWPEFVCAQILMAAEYSMIEVIPRSAPASPLPTHAPIPAWTHHPPMPGGLARDPPMLNLWHRIRASPPPDRTAVIPIRYGHPTKDVFDSFPVSNDALATLHDVGVRVRDIRSRRAHIKVLRDSTGAAVEHTFK